MQNCKHFKEESDDYKMDKNNDGEKVVDVIGFCTYLYFLLISRITII